MKKINAFFWLLLVIPSFLMAEDLSEKRQGTVDDVVVSLYPAGLPSGRDEIEPMLWNTFVERPEIKLFDRLSAKNWEENFDLFSNALVHKASGSEPLSKILKLIKTGKKRGAMVPVGAYSTYSNGASVWVVVVNWESSGNPVYKDVDNDGVVEEGWPVLGHKCVFVYDSTSFDLIAFTSCM